MNVLVDTCVWSLALRRSSSRDSGFKGKNSREAVLVRELRELIREGRVWMMGPIRQELLSGIRSEVQFEKIRSALGAFPDIDLAQADYEQAAQHFNSCRRHGVQGSNTDFLICAAAARLELGILTCDQDFEHFSKYLPVHRHAVRPEFVDVS